MSQHQDSPLYMVYDSRIKMLSQSTAISLLIYLGIVQDMETSSYSLEKTVRTLTSGQKPTQGVWMQKETSFSQEPSTKIIKI